MREVHRRYFEDYVIRTTGGAPRSDHSGLRRPCPCCGYPTLGERSRDEICILCNWQDDGQDDPHADEVWGGPNKLYSLAEARRNFHVHLSKHSPDRKDPRIGGSDSPIVQQAKRSMIAAFDNMVGEDSVFVLEALWRQVDCGEHILDLELSKKIYAYEAEVRSRR